MDIQTIYSFLACFAIIVFLSKILSLFKPKRKLPPSPPSLPILGHLHLLNPPFHRTLHTLAQRYGPIFSLRLGSQPILVVSSSRAAEECFAQNDIVLANRPKFMVGKHLGYNYSAVVWSPYGAYWRNLRRVTTLLAFSGKRINEAGPTRKEEIHDLIKELKKSSESNGVRRKVNLNVLFDKLAKNLVMRVVNGKKWEYEFKTPAPRIINVCDFVPILRWVGFKGIEKEMLRMGQERDEFIEGLMDEFREKRKREDGGENHQTVGGQGRKTLIEELLDLQAEDPEYYTDDILKGIIMIMLTAGTHTSARALEWAMSLLLNHPKILQKARSEINNEVGKNRLIDDSDLPKLSYIRCIVNETLRLFPPAPMLVPHSASQDCIIGGYDVEKGTILFVNAWALHRDPTHWEHPTEFKPERFKKEKELGFNFMPFGVGRRSCPGNNFALRNITLTLATLIQCFEWEMDEGEVVDLVEYGDSIVMPKEKPLEATCYPCSSMIDILSHI